MLSATLKGERRRRVQLTTTTREDDSRPVNCAGEVISTVLDMFVDGQLGEKSVKSKTSKVESNEMIPLGPSVAVMDGGGGVAAQLTQYLGC